MEGLGNRKTSLSSSFHVFPFESLVLSAASPANQHTRHGRVRLVASAVVEVRLTKTSAFI